MSDRTTAGPDPHWPPPLCLECMTDTKPALRKVSGRCSECDVDLCLTHLAEHAARHLIEIIARDLRHA